MIVIGKLEDVKADEISGKKSASNSKKSKK